jgi:excisionase family DNA binding protein
VWPNALHLGGGNVNEQFFTPEEVAELVHLDVVTIRRLCARRVIRAHKPAGRWRISETAYRDWIRSSEPEPGVLRPKDRHTMARPASRWHLRAIEGGDA